MAINKFMRLALKVLSYPDIDIRKTYPLERSIRYLRPPALLPRNRWRDHMILSDGREILTRIYSPMDDAGMDTLLFFHGGGWVTESIDTYNKVCYALACATRSCVVSVEYRLAPEYPFPQGLEDCYAAARELILRPAGFGFKAAGRVTLIGDSAGGNLAAAVSLMARDQGEFCIPRQILIYPATAADHSAASPYPSIRENGSDYLLTAKRICEYIDLYKRSDQDLQSPYFAPLLARNFANQPDTLVITAEYDPLRDEGEAYARQLRDAGNRVTVYRMKDALHGFMGLGTGYVHVRRAHALINSFLSGRDRDESAGQLA